jgi:multidrug efflux pump subunit AcrA (membrane-fusion protein)
VDGAIGLLAVKEGDAVSAGQTIAWLTPDRSTVNDALQALAYIGIKDDLPAIESFAQADASAETAQQAAAAAKAIKSRLN